MVKKMNTLNLFLIFSIIGNMFERILMYFRHTDYVSGFMGTIFTPIYGIAIIIIIFIHKRININNKLIKILIEFIIFSIVLSMIELVGGKLIELVFNKIYWNYDKYKYNIGKYISLETGILWGVMSILSLYIIYPIYKKIEKYIPSIITIILSIAFILNFIIVIIVKLT